MRSAALVAFAALLLGAGTAEAKPAQCETTDEGRYPCDFQATDRKGSFRTTARGKPTYTLLVDEPGDAFASASFSGGRNVPLPGRYLQDRNDRACWVSNATGTRICAR
ncbi:hypothetical protein [uncultured Enterovirga sp.]|uniref:hypothetical protein n=1 Tax=uncultured Enterovirga sp. TaxID=2026352 RepID=UPI0035CA3020